MELIDTTDTEYFTDAGDFDETVGGNMRGSSSAPGTMALFRQSFDDLAHEDGQTPFQTPTSVDLQLADLTPDPRLPLPTRTPGCVVAPLTQTLFVPPAPPLSEVAIDLQDISTPELQRLLISSCNKLTDVLRQIINNPDQGHLLWNDTTDLLVARIRAINATTTGRTNTLGLDVGFTGLSIADHASPTTPSTPGPLTPSPSQRGTVFAPSPFPSSLRLIPLLTALRTPSRETFHPRSPSKGVKLRSPRRPPPAAAGSKKAIRRNNSQFTSEQSDSTSSTDVEAFDMASDGSDRESHPIKPPKALPLTPLSSFDGTNTKVTTRGPRKRRGINPLPPPSRSASSSKMNLNKEPTAMNAPAVPSSSATTASSHLDPLVDEDTQDDSSSELDSELQTFVEFEEEESTSIYKDEIMDKLKNVFGLEKFRTNQARAIDATMSGKYVFVLMPTAGGKSLCYQLPAVCTTGKTKGVTFVISPHISLMTDQVQQLQDKSIDAIMFNSDMTRGAIRKARARLLDQGTKPSLVYLTAERLQSNEDMRQIIGDLVRQGELARFVIDEAHCIPTCGRDFRIAYDGLGFLRQSYPGIPIMALTATADTGERRDIIAKLGIINCVELVQSFNRPNLHYEVRQKKTGVIADIAKEIRLYPEQTGLIYCFSRRNCELVAKELRSKHGIDARHYHAGMAEEAKKVTQEAWMSGDCKIIVATTAFGLGINKSDADFVIHQQIPMSLSNLYQESGRAGRDGRPARCILFYQYTDKYGMDKLIDDVDEDEGPEEKQRKKDKIWQVIQYCENITDCRRAQLLANLGERFDAARCDEACDNCARRGQVSNKDMTEIACRAIELVRSIENSRPTMSEAILAFRGSKCQDIREKGLDKLPMYGKGSKPPVETIGRLFHHLLFKHALKEEYYLNEKGFSNPFITLGDRAEDYIEGRKKFVLAIRP